MKRYYISTNNSKNKLVEVTESEWLSLRGSDEIRPYFTKIYHGNISINDVPEELREAVQAVVDANVVRFGEYNKQEISSNELQDMIEEVL